MNNPDPDIMATILLNWDITFYPFDMGLVIGLLVLVVLLAMSASISGSEVAFFSLTPSDLETIKSSKKKTHRIVESHLKHPNKLLATILVANNFVNVGIVILSTYLVHSYIDFSNSKVLGFVIEVVAITFVLLLFGEILPKIYASSFSLNFASGMSRTLKFCAKLFAPFIVILLGSTNFVNKRFVRKNKNISINEISQALELTSDDEISDDKGILEGIIKFGTTDVDQIMTPRIDVVAIDSKWNFEKVIYVINDSGYSRIPVYTETFDQIDGVLYVKDLLPHIDEAKDFDWIKLIRPPYFVPENKKIDDLLKEFQKAKVHMSVVVDEYGGTSGIVTLEDILEEIVGDIVDEFDDDDRTYARVNDNTFLFDGKTQLNDFFRICELNSEYFDDIKGEADTLAGLLLEMKGNFPLLNERLNYRDIEFVVEAVDKRRIIKIKVIFR